eukprot:7053708-Pyramimonas_sp.AAC.1
MSAPWAPPGGAGVDQRNPQGHRLLSSPPRSGRPRTSRSTRRLAPGSHASKSASHCARTPADALSRTSARSELKARRA